ncbi:MAG: hypothetical protein IJ677_03375 [Alphaproteobacteria bacterium]|nr:hypothetical protein [Alphaproteobacteria bacterium]
MEKIDILLMIAIVECAELNGFTTEELFEFWINLSNCATDDEFFSCFEENEQSSIKKCVTLLEKEFKRRGFKPVNLFQMMSDNPANVARILRHSSLEQLMAMDANLQVFEQTDLIKNFRKLILERMMQIIPMA